MANCYLIKCPHSFLGLFFCVKAEQTQMFHILTEILIRGLNLKESALLGELTLHKISAWHSITLYTITFSRQEFNLSKNIRNRELGGGVEFKSIDFLIKTIGEI